MQYEEYFWEYATETDYLDDIRWVKDHYTDQEKRSDEEAMSRMIDRGLMIAASDDTFKEVFESGKEERIWIK